MTGIRSPRQPGPDENRARARSRHILLIVAAAIAVALVVVAAAVLALRDDRGAAGPGPATPSTSGSPTASPTPSPSPSPTEKTTQGEPSAAEALEPFFAAATRLDEQLRTAAEAINATGPPWEEISPDVARTVRAADLGPVSSAVPAGLPDELRQAVILVLSDLTSRRMAMDSFTIAAPVLPDDSGAAHQTNEQLLTELRNGHEAAVRFDDDLEAARALAAATAPVAEVPEDSRLTAEVLVLVEYVRVANAGCDARGGAVLTTLPEVRWRSVPYLPDAEGTVDGTEFNADLRPDGTWDVYLFVC